MKYTTMVLATAFALTGSFTLAHAGNSSLSQATGTSAQDQSVLAEAPEDPLDVIERIIEEIEDQTQAQGRG